MDGRARHQDLGGLERDHEGDHRARPRARGGPGVAGGSEPGSQVEVLSHLLSHAVLDLLRARGASGSAPGARDDGATLALVLEGGGMRGVVSSAMAAALERRGLAGAFDLVVGTSAGALNGAAFLAGVARGCTDNYCDADVVSRYIAPRRLLIGRAAVDVAYTLEQVTEGLDADRHRRTAQSVAPLHCVAIDVETARPEVLGGFRDEAELRDALLATSRLPWLGGDPVAFRGRRWLDGGLSVPIPVDEAVERGATHVLVLQTRPEGGARTPSHGLVERIIERRLRALNPALVPLARERFAIYEQVVARIAAASRAPSPPGAASRDDSTTSSVVEPSLDAPHGWVAESGAAHVLGVRLPAGTEPIGQLERRGDVLRAAAEAAEAHVHAVLGAA